MVFKNWNSKGREALGVAAFSTLPFGLWPLEKDSINLRIRWSISTLSLSLTIIQAIYDSYMNCAHVKTYAGGLFFLPFGLKGVTKMIFFYKYRDLMRTNVESAVKDWSSEDSKTFSEIMCSWKTNYKKFTRYYHMSIVFVTLVAMLGVVFGEPDATNSVKSNKDGQSGNVTTHYEQKFPIPATCVLSTVPQSLNWTIRFVQTFNLIIGLGVNMACDDFFIAITSHLCNQFEILKMKFANFQKFNNVTETQEKLRTLIARHGHLLKLAQNLETTFTMIVLIQMVSNVFTLNVEGFTILLRLKKRQIRGAVSRMGFILLYLVQTFLYSYVGDRLASQGVDIAQSVYHCEWYSMPTSVSNNVMFIMARTRSPIGLTAGKFFKMTHSTFTDIVKTTLSYLSVVRLAIKDDI